MITSKIKLGLLLAGHLVGGLFLARLNYNLAVIDAVDAWAWVGLFALVFGQAGLLGVWCGLGETPPLLRLPAVEIATIYLCCIVAVTSNYQKVMFALMTVLPIVIIALVLGRLRHGSRRLRLVHSSANAAMPSTARPFQYSIAHIFVITLVVAIILSFHESLRQLDPGFLCGLLPLPCVLASVWATLGVRAKPWLILAIVILGFIFGLVPQYYRYLSYHSVSEIRKMPWWPDLLSWPILFVSQLIIVVGSLLVVRSSGYRLVRSTPAATEGLVGEQHGGA